MPEEEPRDAVRLDGDDQGSRRRILEARGFTEGSNSMPGQFVIERAFVG